jgi:3-deoxy-D-manno-octulosonic-acid transferase
MAEKAGRKEPGGRALIAAYRAAAGLAAPFLPLLLSWRASRGKEERGRLPERRGRASLPRPGGALIWVHAASVGETNAMLPLIGRLTGAGYKVLLTTVTVTSASIATERLPEGAIHQFAPLDVPSWTAAFLDHWRPDLALFTESELWPGIISALSDRRIPMVLVNGRLSSPSFQRWQRLGSLAQAMFSPIDLCLAQTEEYAGRFRAMGMADVAVTGNIKFDVPAPAADETELARLKGWIGARPLWVAASTHGGEETLVADVHRRLREDFPGLMTIIVPRHPARGGELTAELAARGLQVARRSAGEAIGAGTDIYLADTLGELGLFYRLAPLAFVGNSLVVGGGHNPIEPVQLGAVVLHGPNVVSFDEVYAALDAADADCLVPDAAALAAALAKALPAPDWIRRRAETARRALDPFAGSLERTMAALKPFLDRLGAPGVAAVQPR